MRAGGVEVGRLRVHGDGEPLRLRLGVERRLAAADLVGHRLPPAAVLVVRTLRDPLPGRLAIAEAGPDDVWEQRVRDVLDDLLTHAGRPADGPVGANAPAVVFTDLAELLACAWRACARTARPSDWWWQTLRLDDIHRVVDALAHSPTVVPAVLGVLERAADMVPCLRLIDARDAQDLAETVSVVYGRGELLGATTSRLAALQTSSVRVVNDVGRRPIIGTIPSSVSSLAIDLSLSHAVLAEVCRVLGPRHVMSTAALPSAPAMTAPARASSRGRRSPGLSRGRVPARARERPPAGAGDGATPAPEDRASPQDPAASQHPVGPPGSLRDSSSFDAAGPPAQAPPPDPQRPPVARWPQAPSRSLAANPYDPGQVVVTKLGGAFHLVQAGQALGLYGDFTTPAQPGIALPVWDFVSLTAAALAAGRSRDPMWRLLAQLAGRGRGTPPGTGFRPPRTWRVPPAWLDAVDAPGVWSWVEGERPTLLHPTGLPVAQGTGLDRERECARYSVTRCVTAPTLHESRSTARERWVANVAAYLRVRLGLALGLPAMRAGRILCRRPAVVHVTATRLDVVSDLADLPISVRLAGLDRDPGFVPAAGLTVGFVFR